MIVCEILWLCLSDLSQSYGFSPLLLVLYGFHLTFFLCYDMQNELSFLTHFLMGAGSDAILLGAETLRGLYPVETISIVGKICAEVYLFL